MEAGKMESTERPDRDATAYLRLPYARVLTPDEEGGFSAEILEFPGCFAEGETASEALQNLEEVAEAWIQAAQEQGQKIPPPTANQPYAGRIALRLPRDLHRQAVIKAQRDDTSLNQCLVTAVAAWVGADNLIETLARKAYHVINMNLIRIDVSVATSPRYEPQGLYVGGSCTFSGPIGTVQGGAFNFMTPFSTRAVDTHVTHGSFGTCYVGGVSEGAIIHSTGGMTTVSSSTPEMTRGVSVTKTKGAIANG